MRKIVLTGMLLSALVAPCSVQAQVRRVYQTFPDPPTQPNFDPTGGFVYPTPNLARMRKKALEGRSAAGVKQQQAKRMLEMEVQLDQMRQEMLVLRREVAELKKRNRP
jgi:hypothetical protein